MSFSQEIKKIKGYKNLFETSRSFQQAVQVVFYFQVEQCLLKFKSNIFLIALFYQV